MLLNYYMYKKGINGKCWRVIAAFYKKVVASVRLGTRHSDRFHLNRGVKQPKCMRAFLEEAFSDSDKPNKNIMPRTLIIRGPRLKHVLMS